MTALFTRPERAGPLLTKRTRLCPRRRAAEHQQLSDGGRKDVAAAGAMLRGTTRGAGADGMNTIEYLIGGCQQRVQANRCRIRPGIFTRGLRGQLLPMKVAKRLLL